MFADFQNPFTDGFSIKCAIKSSLNISPRLKCVTTLPREILMPENRDNLMKLSVQEFDEVTDKSL